jgi:hypothetical protein
MTDLYESNIEWMQYGRELNEAIELLKVYQASSINLEGLKICFNPNSGYVFLSDEDYNVYMEHNGKLEQWFNCGDCGLEGFKEEFNKNAECEGCKDIATREYTN